MSTTFVSHFSAAGESVVTGSVPVAELDANAGNVFPKMKDRINETAWELWYFDGGTDDGETAVTVSFFRDARGLKDGGFRVQVFALWPDGTQWKDELFFPDSSITAQGESPANTLVRGAWKRPSDGTSASFSVASDLSSATVELKVPSKVSGTITLYALSGSRTGLPAKREDAELSAGMYYMRPISLARVDVALVFDIEIAAKDESESEKKIQQRSLEFTRGRGGMDRCWSSLSWPQIMTESYFLRATVGPYTVQVIRILEDAAREFKPQTLARLWKDQTLVCAAHRVVDIGTTAGQLAEDVVAIEKIYDADDNGLSVTGDFRDKNTGYVVEFLQGHENHQRWRFVVRHKRSWWNMPTSAPGSQATGNSGFLESVSGGCDGEMYSNGCGGGGQVQL